MKKFVKKLLGFSLMELIIVVAIAAIIVAIAIASYSQYVLRAQGSTLLDAAPPAQFYINNLFAANPSSATIAGITIAANAADFTGFTSNTVSAISVNSGVIEIQGKASVFGRVPTLYLVPDVCSGGNSITWSCQVDAASVGASYVPSNCNNAYTSAVCCGSQTWDGSACSCANGGTGAQCCISPQTWTGSACGCTNGGTGAQCCVSPQTWDSTASACDCANGGTGAQCCVSPQTWTGSACGCPEGSTTCPGGQTWNSTTCACACPGGSTTCPGGQTWNSTTCACACPGASTTCPGGQTWNSTLCVCVCPGNQIWDTNTNTCTCGFGNFGPPPNCINCGIFGYWNSNVNRCVDGGL